MKTRTKNNLGSTHDLRESIPAGVKKLRKHGKAVVAVLTGDRTSWVNDLKGNRAKKK